MGWFGPSGDCGCCEEDPCISLPDCDDYPDLEPCECVDYVTGVVETRTKLIFHIVGTAEVGEDGPLTPKIVLDAVDVSGSYEFDIGDNGFGSCTHLTPFTEYILAVEFVGTDSGFDFYAMLVVDGTASLVRVLSLLKLVTTGDSPPTTTAGASLSRSVAWRYNSQFPCAQSPPTCLCPQDYTFTTENVDNLTGWDIIGNVALDAIETVYA